MVLLGVVLLISPGKSQHQILNTMGFFWLTTGFVLLRRDTESVLGGRIPWVIGMADTFSGLIAVTRRITRHWLDGFVVFELLGAIILLTGVIPLDRNPITYWMTILWSQVLRALTLGTTLRDHARAQRQAEEGEQQPETDSVTTK